MRAVQELAATDCRENKLRLLSRDFLVPDIAGAEFPAVRGEPLVGLSEQQLSD